LRFKQNIKGLILAVLCMLSLADAAATTVENVRVWQSPERTRVVLDLSKPPQFKYFALENPLRFVVDLQGASNRADFSTVDFNNTAVLRLRGARRNDGRLRLVLDLAAKVRSEVFALPANNTYGHRLVIDFYQEGSNQRKPQVSIVKQVPDKNAKRNIIIALDAGHGGEDPGAAGPGRIKEKHVVLNIAKKIKTKIDAMPGYEARLVRTGDYYIALHKRRQMAREMHADAFISIHADAFHDKRVYGGSVYTLSADGASSATAIFLANQENEADSIGGVPVPEDNMLAGVIWDLSMGATMDSSAILGSFLLDQMAPIGKLHKREVEHAGFAVLKSPDMPSVLLESGFISNPKEARKLASSRYQTSLAKAVAKGIDNYFREYAVEGTLVYWERENAGAVISHKVKRGETLSGLAYRYQSSMSTIKSFNNLKGDSIQIGQVLKIPRKSGR